MASASIPKSRNNKQDARPELCGVYTFDSDDRLAGEKIYYDRATVLRQLGVFHEPQSVLGRLCIFATHPVTIARALVRKVVGR